MKRSELERRVYKLEQQLEHTPYHGCPGAHVSPNIRDDVNDLLKEQHGIKRYIGLIVEYLNIELIPESHNPAKMVKKK